MQKTVYFHMGMGRCGSSAIQVLAGKNEELLLQQGIAFPRATDLGAELALNHSGNMTGLAQSLRKHPSDTPEGAAAISRLAKYLQSLGAPRCLLSSEFLFSLPDNDLTKLKLACNEAGFRVLAICYVREQREWMISRYGQAVKSRRWTRTLEEYMKQSYKTGGLSYLNHFRSLRSIFEADNLIIRIFERDRMIGRDVRLDFFGSLDIPIQNMEMGANDLNASGNLMQIELMRIINAQPEAESFRFRNKDFLRETQHLFGNGQLNSSKDLYRLVRPTLLRKLGEYYARENEKFKNEFFPDMQGPMFGERIPAQYKMFTPSERISADSVVLLNEYFNRCFQRLRARRGAAASRPVERIKPETANETSPEIIV